MTYPLEHDDRAPLSALINGAWCPLDGAWLEPVDPATGSARPRCQLATPADMARAVEAARIALPHWSAKSQAERFALLDRLRTLVERDQEVFAHLIAQEIGAPLNFARDQQVDGAIRHLRAFCDCAEIPEDDPNAPAHAGRLRHMPLGVAALITPWNWPLNQVVLKLGAALAAGCTCVLKPSELTPRTALHLGALCQEAGVPRGVVNIVPGGAEIGAALVRNRDVDVISFTGSTRAGREIALEAGLRPTIMELGGKSPNLLFADCDLETAIRQGVAHCFRNGGQSCNAASWMLVERAIYPQAQRLAAAEAARYGQSGGLKIGPVITADQLDRVQDMIAAGLHEGGVLVSGGLGPARDKGFYPKPTVIADVSAESSLARTEVFGPVLAMTPFETEDEAITLANSTPYGLSAYVQTRDADRADRVACALRAGMVQVNGTSRATGAPFGGVDASGHGREGGLSGIRAFQYAKSISGVDPR